MSSFQTKLFVYRFIFRGSIQETFRIFRLPYLSLLQASLTSRFTQKMSNIGLFRGHKRVEFVRMRGPGGKGHAEMAVSKLKGAPETPDVESFPIEDFDDEDVRYNFLLSTSIWAKIHPKIAKYEFGNLNSENL